MIKYFVPLLVLTIIIISTTSIATSDYVDFCSKYLLWVDMYKGWLEPGNCR